MQFINTQENMPKNESSQKLKNSINSESRDNEEDIINISNLIYENIEKMNKFLKIKITY
jgi:hypothetical protein